MNGAEMISAEQIWSDYERSKAERAEQFPEFKDCLQMMLKIKERLRDFGWNDGIHAPKNGTTFEVIEWGSTGVFDCSYSGDWPEGHWVTCDGHDLYPSSSAPLMFRLKPN